MEMLGANRPLYKRDLFVYIVKNLCIYEADHAPAICVLLLYRAE